MDNFLYTDASRAKWIERLSFSEQAITYCDNQYVIESDKVAGFFVIDPDNDSYFESLIRLIWIAEKDYPINEHIGCTFLPKAVLGSDTHLFLRHRGDETFVYVGQGYCSMAGNGGYHVDRQHAVFELSNRLSDKWWFHFDGHSGWDLRQDGERDRAYSWKEILPLTEKLFETKTHDLSLCSRQGDTLTICSADDQLFIYYLAPRDLNQDDRMSYNPNVGADDSRTIDFVLDEHLTRMSVRNAVPKTHLLAIIQEFIEYGTLSDKIKWVSGN